MSSEKKFTYTLYKLTNYYKDFIKGSVRKKTLVPCQTLYTAILFKVFSKVFLKMLHDAYQHTIKDVGDFLIIRYQPETKINENGILITNRVLDIQATKEACKASGNKLLRIYRDNEHTNGYIYRVYWKRPIIVNRMYYWFSVYRNNKVIMRDAILAGETVVRETNFKL